MSLWSWLRGRPGESLSRKREEDWGKGRPADRLYRPEAVACFIADPFGPLRRPTMA